MITIILKYVRFFCSLKIEENMNRIPLSTKLLTLDNAHRKMEETMMTNMY